VGEELTWSSTDIVEGKLRNTGVELEEEGQWLSNSTGSTEDGDLGELDRQMLATPLKCDPHGRPVLAEAWRHGDMENLGDCFNLRLLRRQRMRGAGRRQRCVRRTWLDM